MGHLWSHPRVTPSPWPPAVTSCTCVWGANPINPPRNANSKARSILLTDHIIRDLNYMSMSWIKISYSQWIPTQPSHDRSWWLVIWTNWYWQRNPAFGISDRKNRPGLLCRRSGLYCQTPRGGFPTFSFLFYFKRFPDCNCFGGTSTETLQNITRASYTFIYGATSLPFYV